VKRFETGTMLGVKRSRIPQKCLGVRARAEKSRNRFFSQPEKSAKERTAEFRLQELHATCDKKRRLWVSVHSYQQFK